MATDYDVESAALIRALKDAQGEQTVRHSAGIPENRMVSGWYVPPQAGEWMERTARPLLGKLDEERAMRQQAALNEQQRAEYDSLMQQLNTPGTKVLKRTLNDLPADQSGPIGPEVEQQVPMTPLEESRRRMGVYGQMDRLPMARQMAALGQKSEVDFPERQALAEQQQAAAKEAQAARLAMQQSQNDIANQMRMVALGIQQQSANTAQQRADDAKGAAQEKANVKRQEKEAADDAFRTFGEQQIRDIDYLIGARDPQTGALAVDPATGRPVQNPHKGFGQAVGFGVPGLKYVPGTDTASYVKTHEGVMASARLEGVKMMKGAGAVSNAEGAAAASALNKADLAQDEKDYVRAMLDYRNIMQKGLDRRQRGVVVDPVTEKEYPATGREQSASAPAAGGGSGKWVLKPGADPKLRSSYTEAP